VCYQLPLSSVCVFKIHGSSEYEKLLQELANLSRGMHSCHLVQNILSSSLLSNDIHIEIYRSISLPVVFMGVKFGHSH
jgi:hypothetical protein